MTERIEAYPEVQLLDHGYLKLIDVWGSDQRIVEAARMSTDKGFLGWGPRCEHCSPNGLLVEVDNDGKSCVRCGAQVKPGDEKLLAYLWKNAHQTPFEMAGLTVEVQAPIFVFREWHRHRVPFGYNELSARYTPMPDLNYIPSVERLMIGSDGKNKQAGTIAGATSLTEDGARLFQEVCRAQYRDAEREYQAALAYGVPKELARVIVPVGRYSRMRATGNLRGWLGFRKLRLPPTAQWEIRQYAGVIDQLIQQFFPRTHAVACGDT